MTIISKKIEDIQINFQNNIYIDNLCTLCYIVSGLKNPKNKGGVVLVEGIVYKA